MMLAISTSSIGFANSLQSTISRVAPPSRLSMSKMTATIEPPEMEPEPAPPAFDIKDMPGVLPPVGFFDPVGFTSDLSEGRIRFYREVELKHGRVAMLASVGFLLAENFHPLFGGNIDVPSYLAFQQTPLQTFWPAVVFTIAVAEVFSVFTF